MNNEVEIYKNQSMLNEKRVQDNGYFHSPLLNIKETCIATFTHLPSEMENSWKDSPEMMHSGYSRDVEPEAEWKGDLVFTVRICCII